MSIFDISIERSRFVDGLIKGFHDALKESDGSEEQALGLAQVRSQEIKKIYDRTFS